MSTLTIAAKAQEALTTTSAILAAFIRRNRNQHSHSHWWTTVCTLHNHLRKLVDAPREPTASFERRIVERASWICEKELPRCYLQVTQLAADNQHAALGLFLLGLLAQINTSLSPLLPSSVESELQPPKTAKTAVKIVEAQNAPAIERDRGTAIERTSIPITKKTKVEKPAVESTSDLSVKKAKKRTVEADAKEPVIDEKKAKQKKKKKGDAFSDMFGAF